jgi:hypothetical protein
MRGSNVVRILMYIFFCDPGSRESRDTTRTTGTTARALLLLLYIIYCCFSDSQI